MRRLIPLFACLAVMACGESDPQLLNISQPGSEGPDEFSLIPNRPLVIPDNATEFALPRPTPGGDNLADADPELSVTLALGGTEDALRRTGAEPGIVTYASRFGVASDIRDQLAEEDLAFRRANDGRLLERLFSVNIYYDAYRPFSLDQHAELERFRRAGIPTVAAPPDPAR